LTTASIALDFVFKMRKS